MNGTQPLRLALQAHLDADGGEVGLPLRRCHVRAAQRQAAAAGQLGEDALQLRPRQTAGLAGDQHVARGMRRPARRGAQEALLLGDLVGDSRRLPRPTAASWQTERGRRAQQARGPARPGPSATARLKGFGRAPHRRRSTSPGTMRAVIVKLSPSPSARVVGAENSTSAKWPDASIRPISAEALAALPASRTVPCSTSSRVSQASSGSARLRVSSTTAMDGCSPAPRPARPGAARWPGRAAPPQI